MIKFNPFKAGSILLACLMFIFEWDKIEASKKLPSEKLEAWDALGFTPDLNAKDENPVEFFEKHRKLANEDGADYPRNSPFRGALSKNSRVIWAAQNVGKSESWDKNLTKQVSLGIVTNYCQLHKADVWKKLVADLREAMVNPNLDAIMLGNLQQTGSAGKHSMIELVMQSSKAQKTLLALMKEEDSKEENPGAAPDGEGEE